ncbi:MAG: AAA family ATPase, partial [Burkholderia sp.]|nr:AAA family ATPase [Burkholderia sp.]
VDKHIGDCVMAVFGAPVAHGNDAERAVHAALAIRDATSDLGRTVGRDLAVHVGVASGEVVASRIGSVAHREYAVTGETVNLASRLTDRAEPGDVLISGAVHRALAERLDCLDAGALESKGLAEPVRAWRLRGLHPARPDRRPIVGRHGELQQLLGALEACREDGRGAAVHLRGEAGIGKTRLVEKLRQSATERGFACHLGLVLDFGGTGRDAIRAIVRGLLGLVGAEGADLHATRDAAERTLTDGLADAERRVFLNDLLDLPQPAELWSLYDAMDSAGRGRGRRETVADLVHRASARRPLLLVIEDLHWADAGTLSYLAALASTVPHCPALLVTTSRPEGDPLDQAWRGAAGGAPLLTIDLGPLRRPEALALAGTVADPGDPFVLACVERAGGNPLFLGELLRGAEEAGMTNVPASVQSLVLARMDRLTPADRSALQA